MAGFGIRDDVGLIGGRTRQPPPSRALLRSCNDTWGNIPRVTYTLDGLDIVWWFQPPTSDHGLQYSSGIRRILSLPEETDHDQ